MLKVLICLHSSSLLHHLYISHQQQTVVATEETMDKVSSSPHSPPPKPDAKRREAWRCKQREEKSIRSYDRCCCFNPTNLSLFFHNTALPLCHLLHLLPLLYRSRLTPHLYIPRINSSLAHTIMQQGGNDMYQASDGKWYPRSQMPDNWQQQGGGGMGYGQQGYGGYQQPGY